MTNESTDFYFTNLKLSYAKYLLFNVPPSFSLKNTHTGTDKNKIHASSLCTANYILG